MLFIAQVAAIQGVIGAGVVRIYHIDNTAIPCVQAKLVVDMFAEVRDIDAVDFYVQVLACGGNRVFADIIFPVIPYTIFHSCISLLKTACGFPFTGLEVNEQRKCNVMINNLYSTHFFRSIFRTAALISAPIFVSLSVQAEGQHEYFCGLDSAPEAQSLETIIPALYKAVSGDVGSVKNWSLLKNLFAENAMLTPVFHKKTGEMRAQVLSVDEFISLNKELFKDQGFFESEVQSKIFRFGHMANVLSQYESRKSLDAEPYARGVNSFQLLNDGRRWCVISVTWDSDQEYHPISKKMFD